MPARRCRAPRSLVRYADDLVALCHTREQAEQVKARLAEWLAPRGLAFNEDKTRIVHLDDGFDFLGFNVRRYRDGKLLIKPSKAAVKRIRKRLAAEMRALRGANAAAVIARLNPIIRGWAAYYRAGGVQQVFTALDHYVWKLTYKWATPQPPEQVEDAGSSTGTSAGSTRSRHDRWVFGDRDSGAYLPKFAWTNIVRHQHGHGRRRLPTTPPWPTTGPSGARKVKPPLDKYTLRLLTRQDGRCPLCGDHLLHRRPASHNPHTSGNDGGCSVTRKAIAARLPRPPRATRPAGR